MADVIVYDFLYHRLITCIHIFVMIEKNIIAIQ